MAGVDFDPLQQLVGREGLDLDSTHASNVDTNKESSGKRIYIPSRIIILDANNDGIDDIVVNKNLYYARYLQNYKEVKSSEIHAMTWNGLGMVDIWHTSKIDGYTPDFQLLQVKGEKKAQLFVGVALSGGWAGSLGKSESTLLTYDIELSGEKDSR